MKESTIKNWSFPVQIGTLVTIVSTCMGAAIWATLWGSGLESRVEVIEVWKDDGGRFTEEDAYLLETKIDSKFDRIDNKLDQLLLR